MKLAMIGLGKMGANMTRRLARNGHEIVAYDVSSQAVSTPQLASRVGSIRDDARIGTSDNLPQARVFHHDGRRPGSGRVAIGFPDDVASGPRPSD